MTDPIPTTPTGAIIDGPFRYLLWRTVLDPLFVQADPNPRWLVYVGANPSVADAGKDDATIRLWRGQAHRHGFRRFAVVNVFGYIATNPDDMRRAEDAVGPANAYHVGRALEAAHTVVCCWGNIGAGVLADAMESRIRNAGKVPHALSVTREGVPRHPRGLSRKLRFRPLDELRAEALR